MVFEYEDMDGNLAEITAAEYVELLNESIEHYRKMIEWVSAQNPEDNITPYYMHANICTTWFGDHCALCNKFEGCCGCPIYENNNNCEHCINTPWQTMNDATSCGEWLIHAEEEVKLLSTLRFHYGNLIGVTE